MTQVCDMASVGQWKPNTVSRKFYLDRDDLSDSTNSRPQINSDIPPTRRRDILSYKRSLSDDKDDLSGNERQGIRKDPAISSPTDKLNGNNCVDNQDINNMGKDTLQNSSPDDGPTGNVVTSHLKHVHSNPFFLTSGVTHTHGKIYDQQKRKTSLPDDSDVESGAEYGVNSGFVNKLRQKFTTINQRDTSVNRIPPRRFASVENLLGASEKISFQERTRPFSSSEFKTVEQNSNYVRKKPALPKPPRPPKLRPERKKSDSDVEQKQRKPLHSEHEAPDINKIGRNDIIIIEHPKPVPIPEPAKEEKTPTKMNGQTVMSLKDKKVPDELPKPNTVSSFRSMFEKNNTSVSRKLLPDAPKITAKPSKLKVNHKETVESSPLSSPVNKSPEIKEQKPIDTQAETAEVLVKPSTIKERAQEAPRTLDSPVTRKKIYPEKKSIFDSDFNIKTEPTVIQKSRVETTKLEVTSSETSIENIAKSDKKIPFQNKPVIDKNIRNEKSSTNKAGIPARKEIFDSSLIPQSPRPVSVESIVNEVNDKTRTSSSKTQASEETFPGRKKIFDSSLISSSSTTPNVSKKRRAPKPPPSPVPTFTTENKQEPVVNDSVQKSTTDSTSSKVTKKLESAKSSHQPPKPVTPRTQPNKVIETSEPSPVVWLSQEKPSTRSSKVEKKETIESAEKVNNFTPIEISSSDNNTPTRGLPSVIANRLNNKPKNVSSKTTENGKADSSDEDDVNVPHTLVKPSQLRNNSSFLKVSNSPSVPNTPSSNHADSPSEPKNSNSNVPVRNIEDLIRKNRDKPAALFDSSSIVPKVQSKVNGVPPLDLTDLVTEEQNHPYQDGYIPTKIKPCSFKVIGGGIFLDTQPLKKSRSGHSVSYY